MEYNYGLQKYNIKENHNSTRDLVHELYQQDFWYVSIAFTCRTSILHTLRMPVLIIFVQYAIFASLLASNPEAKSVVPELTTRDNPWWRHQRKKTFRVTGPLCGELTGHRWIPLTKASDAELSLICTWINGRVKCREAGDLRRNRVHYDVTVMQHCWWYLFIHLEHTYDLMDTRGGAKFVIGFP